MMMSSLVSLISRKKGGKYKEVALATIKTQLKCLLFIHTRPIPLNHVESAVVDVVKVPCSEFSGDELSSKVSMFLDRAGEVLEPIYVIDSLHGNTVRTISLKKQISFLHDVPAALYTVKQRLDSLGINTIVIITSHDRRTVLQKYQELLFTTLYNFEYISIFDDLGSVGDATSEEVTGASDDVNTFLRQLPAIGEMSVLESPLVDGCFRHGFTTRTGGISYISTLRSLNLFSSSKRRDPKSVVLENIRRLGLKVGFQPHQFNLVKTDHASDVWVVGDDALESYDGIVTNQANVVLAAPGADCMPLLFSDPVAKAIGVAHAGWKGTLMGIAMATVNAMVSRFDCKRENILAVIGPSVGPCCFRLPQPSAKEFQSIHPDCVRENGTSSPNVNIRLATRVLLERGGLRSEHIHDDTVADLPNVTLCTSCHSDMFFSHVRDGNNFGTQIGFLWIKSSEQ